MERMRYKLKSQRGASITFALLLFLVCAIISSVVIVAGTAAAGRMSQIAETDQRYYAVTSAAELLKDALEGGAVRVERTTTTRRTLNQAGEEQTEPAKTVETKLAMYDAEDKEISIAEPDALSMLADAAYYIETNRAQGDKWPYRRTLTLAASGEGLGSAAGEALEVTVTEELQSNGILTLYVTKAAEAGQAYTLKLVFKADVTSNDYVSTERGTPKNVRTEGGATVYTVEETRTDKAVTTLKWTLTDIVKSGAPSAT